MIQLIIHGKVQQDLFVMNYLQIHCINHLLQNLNIMNMVMIFVEGNFHSINTTNKQLIDFKLFIIVSFIVNKYVSFQGCKIIKLLLIH